MQAGAAQLRGREDYNILAKLKRGVTVTQAQTEMDRLTARLRQDFPATYPTNGGLTFSEEAVFDYSGYALRSALEEFCRSEWNDDGPGMTRPYGRHTPPSRLAWLASRRTGCCLHHFLAPRKTRSEGARSLILSTACLSTFTDG
jgi:hypothetical protein